jgi:hypothetical protein
VAQSDTEGDAQANAHVLAQAAGLERYFRSRALDIANRLLIVVFLLGGLATAMSSRSPRAMEASILISVALGVALALPSTLRYVIVRRRLRRDPEREIARLHAHADARLRYFLGDVTSRP